jgi:hypothetical protein
VLDPQADGALVSTRLTRLADIVPAVTAELEGNPLAPVNDRHVTFLRRNADVARRQHARSIAAEMEAIATRLECAIRAGQLIAVPEDPR